MSRPARRPLLAAVPRGNTTVMHAPTTDTYTDGIDWIAVERAAHGTYDSALLTTDEKHQAALLMLRAGYAAREISIRLCVYERQVVRWKAAAGLSSTQRLCDEPGCGKPHVGRGMCSAHLSKDRRAAAKYGEAA